MSNKAQDIIDIVLKLDDASIEKMEERVKNAINALGNKAKDTFSFETAILDLQDISKELEITKNEHKAFVTALRAQVTEFHKNEIKVINEKFKKEKELLQDINAAERNKAKVQQQEDAKLYQELVKAHELDIKRLNISLQHNINLKKRKKILLEEIKILQSKTNNNELIPLKGKITRVRKVENFEKYKQQVQAIKHEEEKRFRETKDRELQLLKDIELARANLAKQIRENDTKRFTELEALEKKHQKQILALRKDIEAAEAKQLIAQKNADVARLKQIETLKKQLIAANEKTAREQTKFDNERYKKLQIRHKQEIADINASHKLELNRLQAEDRERKRVLEKIKSKKSLLQDEIRLLQHKFPNDKSLGALLTNTHNAKTIKDLDRIKLKLREVRGELNKQNNSQSFLERFKKISTSVFAYDIYRRLTEIIKRAITAMYKWGVESIKTADNFNLLRLQLTAVTKSTSEVKKIFNELQEITLKTPFQIKELVKAAFTLTGLGVKYTKDLLKAITDVATVANRTPEEIAAIIGKLNAGEPQALSRSLPTLGISSVEYRKELLKVENIYNATAEAFTNIVKKRFGGLAELFSQTLEGMESNLKDRVAILQDETGQEAVKVRIEEVKKLSDEIDHMSLSSKGALIEWNNFIASLQNIPSVFLRIITTTVDTKEEIKREKAIIEEAKKANLEESSSYDEYLTNMFRAIDKASSNIAEKLDYNIFEKYFHYISTSEWKAALVEAKRQLEVLEEQAKKSKTTFLDLQKSINGVNLNFPSPDYEQNKADFTKMSASLTKTLNEQLKNLQTLVKLKENIKGKDIATDIKSHIDKTTTDDINTTLKLLENMFEQMGVGIMEIQKFKIDPSIENALKLLLEINKKGDVDGINDIITQMVSSMANIVLPDIVPASKQLLDYYNNIKKAQEAIKVLQKTKLEEDVKGQLEKINLSTIDGNINSIKKLFSLKDSFSENYSPNKLIEELTNILNKGTKDSKLIDTINTILQDLVTTTDNKFDNWITLHEIKLADLEKELNLIKKISESNEKLAENEKKINLLNRTATTKNLRRQYLSKYGISEDGNITLLNDNEKKQKQFENIEAKYRASEEILNKRLENKRAELESFNKNNGDINNRQIQSDFEAYRKDVESKISDLQNKLKEKEGKEKDKEYNDNSKILAKYKEQLTEKEIQNIKEIAKLKNEQLTIEENIKNLESESSNLQLNHLQEITDKTIELASLEYDRALSTKLINTTLQSVSSSLTDIGFQLLFNKDNRAGELADLRQQLEIAQGQRKELTEQEQKALRVKNLQTQIKAIEKQRLTALTALKTIGQVLLKELIRQVIQHGIALAMEALKAKALITELITQKLITHELKQQAYLATIISGGTNIPGAIAGLAILKGAEVTMGGFTSAQSNKQTLPAYSISDNQISPNTVSKTIYYPQNTNTNTNTNIININAQIVDKQVFDTELDRGIERLQRAIR